VCGPDGGPSPAPRRLASALLPFGAPFPTPPEGFLDLGVALPGQPDAYFPMADARPEDPAVEISEMSLTYADLDAAGGTTDRILLTSGVLARDIAATLAAARGGGSMVLVSHATSADLDRLASQEQARIA
jgi:hypothetical protein